MDRENLSRLSRRKLLAGVGFGVAAVGALAAPALQLSWTRKPGARGSWWDRQFAALRNAGLDEWRRHLGSEFRMQTESGPQTFRLTEIRPFAPVGARPRELGRGSAFMAVFDAPGNASLAGDRIYSVKHSAGDLDIFFGPAGSHSAGTRLEAVFN